MVPTVSCEQMFSYMRHIRTASRQYADADETQDVNLLAHRSHSHNFSPAMHMLKVDSWQNNIHYSPPASRQYTDTGES